MGNRDFVNPFEATREGYRKSCSRKYTEHCEDTGWTEYKMFELNLSLLIDRALRARDTSCPKGKKVELRRIKTLKLKENIECYKSSIKYSIPN